MPADEQIYSQVGSFVPLTNALDPAIVYTTEFDSEQFKQFLVKVIQTINNINLVLNTKDSGYYVLQEFLNGQLYFPTPLGPASTATELPQYRQVFRTVINFGALPNSTQKQVFHNIPIDQNYSFTRIYATASDPVTPIYIPIPNSTTTGEIVSLAVGPLTVAITTNFNATNYTLCYVVLEYIKEL